MHVIFNFLSLKGIQKAFAEFPEEVQRNVEGNTVWTKEILKPY